MILSILQLNINADNYFDKLIHFITTNDFDILQLQEIAGKDTVLGNIHSKRDCFLELQKILEKKYFGELAIAERYTSSHSSYLGNAIFYKKSFSLEKKTILPLLHHEEPYSSDATSYEDEGRVLLHVKLSIAGKTVSFLSTHFAWAKTNIEKPHQTKQSEILLSYLQNVAHPFIMCGDFNLTPEQPTIQKINTLARNLITEQNIHNTLNPRLHAKKNLFPKGLAVDYIFVSNEVKVLEFNILETEDLSDHLALTATIEI